MGRGKTWGFVIVCLFTLSDVILMHNPGLQEFPLAACTIELD